MANPTFFNQPPSTWNIIDYLDQHDPTSPSYNHQHTLDKWIKALVAISSDAKSTPEQRDEAEFLKDKYRQLGRDSDRIRAREWLANFQPSKKKKQNTGSSVNIYKAPVNITQGTFENSVINSTINQSGKRKVSDYLESSDSTGDDGSLDEGLARLDKSKQRENTAAATDPTEPPQVNDVHSFKEFVATYKAMTEESKFVFFDSGRVLEDVIFENATVLTEKSTAHLWVVDTDNSVITSWFQPKELEELRRRMLPMPELDECFLASMARFSHADTTEEFRRIVEEVPYRPKDEPYDRAKHFDAAWVNIVILSMLSILESPNNLLHYPNLCEGWYDCNPWSFLIDQCLLGLNGVLVQRKEILCLALKLTNPLPARRFDAIIHTLAESPVLEYGAIEVAKSFESVHARKWSADSSKLVLALHAMLGRLKGAVGGDPEIVRKLQVVGLMNAGVRMQVVRMGVVNGNVAVLERGKVKSLPTEVGVLRALFGVLISVVMFKRMIQDCVEAVKSYNALAGVGAEKTREEFMEELGKQNEL